MNDFSDKYRRAVDSLNFSSDFKERTAAKMIALRDGGNVVSADMDVNGKKIRFKRILYTAGAAAACAAVCVSVWVLGLPKNPQIVMYTENETAVPEQTDVLPDEEISEETAASSFYGRENDIADSQTGTETAMTENSEDGAFEPPDEENGAQIFPAAVSETTEIPETEAVFEMSAIPETEAAKTESTAAESAPASRANPLAGGTPASETASAVSETLPMGRAEYVAPVGNSSGRDEEIIDDEEDAAAENPAPVMPAPAPTTSADSVGEDESFLGYESGGYVSEAPVEAVVTDEPSEEEAVSDEYEADAEGTENTSGFSDPAFTYEGAVGYDFSAYDQASKFDRKNAYATITPLFEEYDESTGEIVSYSAGEVRGTVKMRELISAAALYARDGQWEAVSAPPGNSRYIIDFADEEGNSLRAYAGEGFICYAAADMKGNEPVNEVVYCYFKLSEKESERLEELLNRYVV